MSKIIAFLGSPRRNGNTAKLVEQVIAGAKAAGAEVITYNLNDERIRGCQGCNYCRTHEGCATQDKLQPMYEQINQAEGIVASFPIYFANISSQSKQWLDRLYPMITDDFSPRCPDKKIVTVYSQANGNKEILRGVIESNDRRFSLMFGWKLINSLLSYGSADPNYLVPQELMDKAFEAGRQLVR